MPKIRIELLITPDENDFILKSENVEIAIASLKNGGDITEMLLEIVSLTCNKKLLNSALDALVQIGDARGISCLIHLMTHQNYNWLPDDHAQALIKKMGRTAIPFLLEALISPDISFKAFDAAFYRLFEMKVGQAMEQFVKKLKQPWTENTRWIACNSLTKADLSWVTNPSITKELIDILLEKKQFIFDEQERRSRSRCTDDAEPWVTAYYIIVAVCKLSNSWKEYGMVQAYLSEVSVEPLGHQRELKTMKEYLELWKERLIKKSIQNENEAPHMKE